MVCFLLGAGLSFSLSPPSCWLSPLYLFRWGVLSTCRFGLCSALLWFCLLAGCSRHLHFAARTIRSTLWSCYIRFLWTRSTAPQPVRWLPCLQDLRFLLARRVLGLWWHKPCSQHRVQVKCLSRWSTGFQAASLFLVLFKSTPDLSSVYNLTVLTGRSHTFIISRRTVFWPPFFFVSTLGCCSNVAWLAFEADLEWILCRACIRFW